MQELVQSYSSSIYFDQYGLMQPEKDTKALDPFLILPRSDINRKVMFASLIDTRTNMSVYDTVLMLKTNFGERFRPKCYESMNVRPDNSLDSLLWLLWTFY